MILRLLLLLLLATPLAAQDRAVNLAAIADWSTEVPFIDMMKSSRPLFGHRPGQWGGMDHADLVAAGVLDSDGWPTRIPDDLASIGTLILTDMPEAATSLAGRYVLRFDGTGIVEVAGRATQKRYADNAVSFDYTPGPGPVDIRIQQTDPTDPVRAITVIRADMQTAYAAGARFNPRWLERIAPFGTVRLMDWMDTNDSEVEHWDLAPHSGQQTYATDGVPLALLVDLANQTAKDPWFTLPNRADDAYIRTFAQTVHDTLDPNLTAYVEYSNEVWNWQFQQTAWADAQARARWDTADVGTQFYGMRSAQTADIWRAVFADAPERLVTVISTQTGWLGLEDNILNAPLWMAEDPANRPPRDHVDAYAVTGYFGGIIGTEGRADMVRGWIADSEKAATEAAQGQAEADAYIAAHRYDAASAVAGQELRDGSVSGDPADTLADLLGKTLPYHAAVAEKYGLRLLMYEGGSHVTGIGPMADDAAITDFLIHFNYTPEMGALTRELMAGWDALGGGPFTQYADVYAPTKWGSWGGLRHIDDVNPRWDALTGE